MDATSKLLKSMRRPVFKTGPEIPIKNNSGDYSRGTVRTNPQADNQIVNKAYADSLIAGGSTGTFTSLNITAGSNFIVFDSDGVNTGTLTASFTGTRTITLPNSSGTLLITNNDNVIIDNTMLAVGSGTDSSYSYRNTMTPDSAIITVSADSKGLVIADQADRTFDFAHALQSNPTLFIHSANQSTTEWIGITHDATDGVITVGTGTLKLGSSGMWTANGSGTVTISNLAPAGVGTATISQWLTLVASDGVTYYIPAWT